MPSDGMITAVGAPSSRIAVAHRNGSSASCRMRSVRISSFWPKQRDRQPRTSSVACEKTNLLRGASEPRCQKHSTKCLPGGPVTSSVTNRASGFTNRIFRL